MTNYKEQLAIQKQKLLKALRHLEYSYKKVQNLPENIEKLDEEGLETWESFAARFGRVAEIFLTRYLRTIALINDPGFSGTLRDTVNLAEKKGLIDNANSWMSIRELRNISAHDYSDKDLMSYFQQLKKECPKLLAIKNILNQP